MKPEDVQNDAIIALLSAELEKPRPVVKAALTVGWPLKLRKLGERADGREVWLFKTEWGNYGVDETGGGGGSILGTEEDAIRYATERVLNK